MKTGYEGTFVISWAQTEIDGLTGAPVGAITVGTTWRWVGDTVRIDAAQDVFVLENSTNYENLRARAAKSVRAFVGADYVPKVAADEDLEDFRLSDAGFELTDGRETFNVALVNSQNSGHPVVVFMGRVPPKNQDLWVVRCTTEAIHRPEKYRETAGVICFVPNTYIRTPDGTKAVQDLCEGDKVCTKDNGVQEIRWIGHRRISGARLRAMPSLRPIRLRSHVLGQGEPDHDLIVSPEHRVLVQGEVAQALFNTSEVLIGARDLVNDKSITVDHSLREVTYVHLMLDQHQVLWANGVQCDSFHPAGSRLEMVDPLQRDLLFERFPDIAADAHTYGDFARRNLTASEAAILMHEM